MDTEYADRINSLPVIYVTFKDCKGQTPEELLVMLKRVLGRNLRATPAFYPLIFLPILSAQSVF